MKHWQFNKIFLKSILIVSLTISFKGYSQSKYDVDSTSWIFSDYTYFFKKDFTLYFKNECVYAQFPNKELLEDSSLVWYINGKAIQRVETTQALGKYFDYQSCNLSTIVHTTDGMTIELYKNNDRIFADSMITFPTKLQGKIQIIPRIKEENHVDTISFNSDTVKIELENSEIDSDSRTFVYVSYSNAEYVEPTQHLLTNEKYPFISILPPQSQLFGSYFWINRYLEIDSKQSEFILPKEMLVNIPKKHFHVTVVRCKKYSYNEYPNIELYSHDILRRSFYNKEYKE